MTTLRIGAVMATVPERNRAGYDVLDVLSRQCDSVTVHLVGSNFVPEWCERANVLIRHRERRGPAIVLSQIPDDVDVVLLADDDIDYPPDYVQRSLASLVRLGPRRAISYHVHWWRPDVEPTVDRWCGATYADGRVEDVPATVLGCGVAMFWRDDLARIARDPPPREFEKFRDVWTSYALQQHGVRIVRPPSPEHWLAIKPIGHTGLWTEPGRVEQSNRVIRRLIDERGWHPFREDRTCLRCGRVPTVAYEDCVLGAEVPGAGTEPHVFSS